MRTSSAGRRALYLFSCVLFLWAVVAYYTGGVGWAIGPLRISSRDPLRPLLAGLLAGAWYMWRYSARDREADGSWLLALAERPAVVWAAVLTGAAAAIGIAYGTFAAAGSDSYGYVSQAKLWLSGTLRLEQPWVDQFTWTNREWMFAPLGYRPSGPSGAIVPTYPAGLPMLMAPFLAIFGEAGPFYVVPVLGAAAVWATYALGTEATGSKGVGTMAALMLLASPVFLAHIISPMSDVPAAALWTLAALFVFRGQSRAAGWMAGIALLVRPNLFLLALVPVIAWRSAHARERLIAYAASIAPAVVAILVLNSYLYGSPLMFGYGTLFESYSLELAPANARTYAAWLFQTTTPLVLLALVPLAAKDALREDTADVSFRRGLAAIVALTVVSYVFYGEFTHWFYMRFLLPAVPALLILLAAGLRWLCLRMPVEARVPVGAVVLAIVAGHGATFGQREGIFRLATFEQRHVRAAGEVAARTPDNAVVLAVQHSGSVRYYTGRITLRYDWLPEDQLDAAVRDLTAKGYRPYLVVDDWEEKEFRARFATLNAAARLDGPAIARVAGSPEVRVYELR